MHLTPIIDRRASLSRDGNIKFSINDLLPDEKHRASLLHSAALLAVHALTQYGDGFSEYQDHPLFKIKPRRPLPEAHKTRIIPVVSTLGAQYTSKRHTAIIEEAYSTKLEMEESSFIDRVIPCINDAATNDAIRRAQMVEVDNPSFDGLFSLQLGPGLNDIMRKMVKNALKNHSHGLSGLFGTINKSYLSLGKPQDHDAALSALESIVTSSLLDCWRINCGYPSVEKYAASRPKPEAILVLAKKIIIKHAKRVVPPQPDRFPDDKNTLHQTRRIPATKCTRIIVSCSATLSTSNFSKTQSRTLTLEKSKSFWESLQSL
ncbi:hypothetical protein DXG01_001987 [Tephrocybe rancida]|nr:hypothetical protein DXG01_001987 [Tephrocybe rancida]